MRKFKLPVILAMALALTIHAPASAAAPGTTITGGPSGTRYTSAARFSFSSSQSGSSFQCKLDAGSWTACSSPKSYTVAYKAHTFYVRARNSSGQLDATPAYRTWTAKAPVAIALNCESNPETTRVVNANPNASVVVKTVGSLYQPYAAEPYLKNKTLSASAGITYQSGAAAASNVLTRSYIYNNDASTEGTRVVTSAGTVTRRCP